MVISTPAVRAAMAQTDMIPIVFVAVDPLGTGLVSRLARPGRNVIGLSLTLGEKLAGKWPELLREVVPRPSRVRACQCAEDLGEHWLTEYQSWKGR
jgi:putative tryptophan/tyrosine transport system substrate-binding protein